MEHPEESVFNPLAIALDERIEMHILRLLN